MRWFAKRPTRNERQPLSEIACERGLQKMQQSNPTCVDAVVHAISSNPAIKKLFKLGNHDFLPNVYEQVEIDTDIFFELQKLEMDETAVRNIKFRLFSFEHDVRYLQRFVESCTYEYDRTLQNKLGKSLFYFDQIVKKEKRKTFDNPMPTDFLVYSKHRFTTTRTFENVYFDQQEKVKTHTKFFLENRKWYETKGIPYTLGFLFHGEPGCGKTSETKAIANIAHRHIFNIQLSEIKTKAQLHHLFFNEEVHVWNGKGLDKFVIPVHERVFVIEDVDAMGDVVMDRTLKTPSLPPDPFVILDDNEAMKDPIDLSFLLNILDGTLESPGRMLVMTSNFPERIDKALIRPGRVDMTIKFTKCSTATLRQMYQGFYDKHPPDHALWSLPPFKWTPAEVNQIMFRNADDSSNALNELFTLTPSDLCGFEEYLPLDTAP